MSNRIRRAVIAALLVLAVVAPGGRRCSGVREPSRGGSHDHHLRRPGYHRRPRDHHPVERRTAGLRRHERRREHHTRPGGHRGPRRRRPDLRVRLGRHLECELQRLSRQPGRRRERDLHPVLGLPGELHLPLGGRLSAEGQPGGRGALGLRRLQQDGRAQALRAGRGDHRRAGDRSGDRWLKRRAAGGRDRERQRHRRRRQDHALVRRGRHLQAQGRAGRLHPLERARALRRPAGGRSLHLDRQDGAGPRHRPCPASAWPASAGARARCSSPGRPTTRPAPACRTTRSTFARWPTACGRARSSPGEWKSIVDRTTLTGVHFRGDSGHAYQFRITAVDRAANRTEVETDPVVLPVDDRDRGLLRFSRGWKRVKRRGGLGATP